MAPKHEVVVKDLQKQCNDQTTETGKMEAEATQQKAAADKLQKEQKDLEDKLKERQSLMEKFKKDMVDAKKTLEADHGDLEGERVKAEKEAASLLQSAEKVREEIEEIRRRRTTAKTASKQKVVDIEKQIKEHEDKAKELSPSVNQSLAVVDHYRQDYAQKKTKYAETNEVRDNMAAHLKQTRGELDSLVLQRQQALDKKEELELEDARGVVEGELLLKQTAKLKQLVPQHEANLPVVKEEVAQLKIQRDAVIKKTEELKKAIVDLEEKIVKERQVAAEKRDICKVADKELDEVTAAARRTSTLLKHALQDVEEQNEDLQQCEADLKELRGNFAGTRSMLHDARANQELAEEKEELLKSRLAQRSDDLLKAKRERDTLNDFADGYLREIGHTVSIKTDVLNSELAKHAAAWTSNRIAITRHPLTAGTGESSSAVNTPRSGMGLSPQEAGTQDLRNRMFQHRDPSQLSATQRAAFMCLEKTPRSPTPAVKLVDESTGGTNGLSNKALVNNLAAQAMPERPMTSC